MIELVSLVFTIMSGVGSVLAVIVAILIYKRQRKLTLFTRRRQILDDYEHFLLDVLPHWEWDGSCDWIKRFSDEELVALFDEDVLTIKVAIIEACDQCDKLLGDIKYAQTHGHCNGKSDVEIEETLAGLIKATRNFYYNKVASYNSLFKI